jgi:hypothetical protein
MSPPPTVPPHLISALERAAAGGYSWAVLPNEAEALLCALKAPLNPAHLAHLARACSDISTEAKATAKAMHASGDSAGGYYSEGRDAAMEWLSYQLLNPDSSLMKGLRASTGEATEKPANVARWETEPFRYPGYILLLGRSNRRLAQIDRPRSSGETWLAHWRPNVRSFATEVEARAYIEAEAKRRGWTVKP